MPLSADLVHPLITGEDPSTSHGLQENQVLLPDVGQVTHRVHSDGLQETRDVREAVPGEPPFERAVLGGRFVMELQRVELLKEAPTGHQLDGLELGALQEAQVPHAGAAKHSQVVGEVAQVELGEELFETLSNGDVSLSLSLSLLTLSLDRLFLGGASVSILAFHLECFSKTVSGAQNDVSVFLARVWDLLGSESVTPVPG